MSLFRTILEKLGFGDASAQASAPQAGPAVESVTVVPADAPPVAIPVVDVVAKLQQLAAGRTEKLNWKTSIVDLLKLLEIDGSFAARKDLATELGCPASALGDSAKMNMWLHKVVLQKIAENGGNVPKELID